MFGRVLLGIMGVTFLIVGVQVLGNEDCNSVELGNAGSRVITAKCLESRGAGDASSGVVGGIAVVVGLGMVGIAAWGAIQEISGGREHRPQPRSTTPTPNWVKGPQPRSTPQSGKFNKAAIQVQGAMAALYGSTADFTRSDLSGEDLSGADLSRVDLSGADLSGANLEEARLQWTDLSGANLSGANLSGAYIGTVNFSGASFSGANLTGLFLRYQDFALVDFSFADLSGTVLHGSDLSEADLTGADLTGAASDDETLWPDGFDPIAAGVTFDPLPARPEPVMGTTGIGPARHWRDRPRPRPAPIWEFNGYEIGPDADLSGVDLAGVDLSEMTFDKAKFAGANLAEANLANSYLLARDFSGANLVGANLSGAYLIMSFFAGADLSGANLSEATLSNARLAGANLAGANLQRVMLSTADLSGANLEGALLEGAIFTYLDAPYDVYLKATAWPEGFDWRAAGVVLLNHEDWDPLFWQNNPGLFPRPRDR